MTSLSASEVGRLLHEKIPLTRAMGVEVEWEEGRLILRAPLEANHNHLGTAFGGSLSALGTLAGYTWLWLALGEPGAHVVIAGSTVEYLQPVTGELRAEVVTPSLEEIEAFRLRYQRKGKARMMLEVITAGVTAGKVAFRLRGTFVALGPASCSKD